MAAVKAAEINTGWRLILALTGCFHCEFLQIALEKLGGARESRFLSAMVFFLIFYLFFLFGDSDSFSKHDKSFFIQVVTLYHNTATVRSGSKVITH